MLSHSTLCVVLQHPHSSNGVLYGQWKTSDRNSDRNYNSRYLSDLHHETKKIQTLEQFLIFSILKQITVRTSTNPEAGWNPFNSPPDHCTRNTLKKDPTPNFILRKAMSASCQWEK